MDEFINDRVHADKEVNKEEFKNRTVDNSELQRKGIFLEPFPC